MNKTAIEWTDYTWNPITGCLKGCDYCYAKRIATRFAGGSAFPNGFEPTFHPERLSEKFPKKPSKIFTCSMGELFGDWLPAWQVEDVFDTIRAYPQHTFQLLTKQPQNLIKWSPFPENCWVGVSATGFQMYGEGLHYLSYVDASVKFVSFEPLLEQIQPKPWGPYTKDMMATDFKSNLQWLIIGSRTQPTQHPPREWVDEIISAADTANIPVFVKEPMASYMGINRQEFPDQSSEEKI